MTYLFILLPTYLLFYLYPIIALVIFKYLKKNIINYVYIWTIHAK